MGSGNKRWCWDSNLNKEEVKNLDRKTMKLLSMHGAFHPKSDIDRLYLPKGIKARVKRIGIPVKVEFEKIQKTTLHGTARILRRVLES